MTRIDPLSFLPEDYVERKQQRRANVICAVLFSVVMIAIASAFTMTQRNRRDLEREHSRMEQQYNEAAKRIEQVHRMQEQQRHIAHQAELTASLLERVPRSYLLASITNALPQGVSMIDIVLESKVKPAPVVAAPKTALEARKAAEALKAPQVIEPRQYDVSIRLTGVAQNDIQVAQLITRLSASPLLRDVNLVITDEFTEKDEKMRKFQIEMMLNTNAQVEPPSDHTARAASDEREVAQW